MARSALVAAGTSGHASRPVEDLPEDKEAVASIAVGTYTDENASRPA